MFRRHWSSLPADPEWPADLTKLGYFVNKVDEIRNIQEPNKYFKYFVSKNMRWNDRQRFAMNQTVEAIIHTRLEQEHGMVKGRLPPGTPFNFPHVPIYMSKNLTTASRIVVLFGEAVQDLGILACRVVCGPGGIDQGSMCSVVRAIRQILQNEEDTGILIANPGQLWWWPEGKRGLTPPARHSIPMKSAVHWGREYDATVNAIPGHETVGQHVKSIFESVLGKIAREDAKLAVIAVGDVADEVEGYLDDGENWKVWGLRMESLALLGNYYTLDKVKCEGFRAFLEKRARAWIHDYEPLNTPFANPEGRPRRPGVGCPVFSIGPDVHLSELMLIHAHEAVLKWMKKVAANENYKNPRLEIEENDMEGKVTSHWTEEDGKYDTPAPEKQHTKKPTLEKLASAVKEEIAGTTTKSESSPKKTDAEEAGGETEETADAQPSSKPTEAVGITKEISLVEEVPMVQEDPAEEEMRLKKEKEELDARLKQEQEEKEARLKTKKEEDEKSNLEYMRHTVLHALDGLEEMLAAAFGKGDSTVRRDSDDDDE